jgi:tRNA/tmRNA/rRNA uracil-C5-methylase (TrmA/RlmC/RlmD family)
MTGRVVDLSSDGRSISRLNCNPVFIEGALSGEDVDLEAIHHHRDYVAKIAGKVVEIEGSNGSVTRLLANEAHDDSKSIRCYQGDLFQDQVHAVRLRRVYDHLLLDPPQTGVRKYSPIWTTSCQRALYIFHVIHPSLHAMRILL